MSGFYDGGYSDPDRSPLHVAYQFLFIAAIAVAGVLAALRFVSLLRRRPMGKGGAAHARPVDHAGGSDERPAVVPRAVPVATGMRRVAGPPCGYLGGVEPASKE